MIKTLGFDIVHGCQLRCVGCPNSTIKPKIQLISAERFKTCLSNIDVKWVRVFRMFNFGEPLFHPELPQLVKCVRESGLKVKKLEISTNAQHHDFDTLAKTFETKQLNVFVVSCDGNGTPNDYERLRPPAKWDRLLTFLREGKMLRDTYSPNTKLITRTICTDPEGQKRWINILHPLGWTPQFRGWMNLPEAAQQNSNWEGRGHHCRFTPLGRDLFIDFDGIVVPCCQHPRAFVLGDLKTHKYSDIIAGDPWRRFAEMLRNSRQDLAVCRNCAISPPAPPRLPNKVF